MKRFFPVVVFLCWATVFGQNDCQKDFAKMVKNRYQCIHLFQEAADPSKQPREGVLDLTENSSLDSCLGLETRTFSGFNMDEECRDNYFPDIWKPFKPILKACVNRYNMASCSTTIDSLLGEKKMDSVRDSMGATLLLRAAEALDTNSFNLFLQKGANVHAVDLNGQNVLMYALKQKIEEDDSSESLKSYNDELRKKQLVLVKKILALGVSPNALDLYGRNALFYALFVPGIESVVDELLLAKANTAVSVVFPLFAEERNYPGFNKVRSNFFESLHLVRLSQDSLEIKMSPYFKKVWMATENWGKQVELYSETGDTSAGQPVSFFEMLGTLSKKLNATAFDELIVTALQKGGSPNLVDDSGYNQMRFAIERSNQKLVQKLISQKYDLKSKVYQLEQISLNALEYAVYCDEKEIVKMLVKAKANVRESIALNIAVAMNNVEMAKLLIGFKANVNDDFLSLLDGMIYEKVGVGSAGVTLLEYAGLAGFVDMKSLLKKSGAVKPFRSNFVYFCLDSNLTTADVLGAIQKGADVNEVDENGWTPLHSIAQVGKDAKLVDILVKKGAFVNATTSKGVSPFFIAANNNTHPAILKALVKYGADISITLDGGNALCYAVAHNSNPAVVATLLEMGLDEYYSDRDKNNLVLIAVRNNPNEKILIQLFKSGYKVNPEYSEGDAPLEVALENQKDVKIIKTLLQAHAEVTDRAMSIAKNWPVGKYRNQVMDMLIKSRRKK